MDAVRDDNPELALSALKFWERFIMRESVTLKENSRRRYSTSKSSLLAKKIDRLLPMLLESCKMKRGDFENSQKGKLLAEFLDRKVEVDRMTIRSMAAKNIEKISGISLFLPSPFNF